MILSWIIAALIAAWAVGAIVWLHRRKKRGGPCVGCTCSSCTLCERKKEAP